MKKIIYIFTIALFTLTSCDKNEIDTLELTQKADVKSINNNIDALSSVIAKASGDNLELRKFIKTEVGKRFDYDYDALLVTFIGKEIADEKFEKILANHSNGKYTSDQIIKMIKSSGYLQISIPVLFDEFVPENNIPLTVAIPVDTNEDTVENFNAYDDKGIKSKISAKSAPDELVFVIMESERVDKEGNVIVDEDGIFIEDKVNRIHYSKAITQTSNLQKVKRNKKKLINVVSDLEFEKSYVACKESENRFLSGQKRISSASQVNLGPILQVTPKDQLQLQLTWQAYNNSNRYEIYRVGAINVNGTKIPGQTIHLKTVTDTYIETDNVHYANEEYTYYIRYFNNDSFIGETFPSSAHSSHRKNGGLEYIKNVTVSASTVVRLEGWWVSEIELRCQYIYVNYNGELVNNLEARPTIYTKGSGATGRYINWTYGDTMNGRMPTGTGNLFTWDRQGSGYGCYTLVMEELDSSDNRADKLTLIFDWVRFGLKTAGASQVWTEFTDQVQKTINILDKPDYIGTVSIKWWDPENMVRNPCSGFNITINHNPNNN